MTDSNDMSIRLANWFSADPLGEVFADPSACIWRIKCVALKQQDSACLRNSEHSDENVGHNVKPKLRYYNVIKCLQHIDLCAAPLMMDVKNQV